MLQTFRSVTTLTLSRSVVSWLRFPFRCLTFFNNCSLSMWLCVYLYLLQKRLPSEDAQYCSAYFILCCHLVPTIGDDSRGNGTLTSYTQSTRSIRQHVLQHKDLCKNIWVHPQHQNSRLFQTLVKATIYDITGGKKSTISACCQLSIHFLHYVTLLWPVSGLPCFPVV